MKALPKRKGNPQPKPGVRREGYAPMKVFARKRRNSCGGRSPCSHVCRLNEGPYGKVGKYTGHHFYAVAACASMKAPPEKEGKSTRRTPRPRRRKCLNEGPYKIIGKYSQIAGKGVDIDASMKAPPKRKGNPDAPACSFNFQATPQ